MSSERNSYWREGGGGLYCIHSKTVHCYKGNILHFDNDCGGGGGSPQPPVPTALQVTSFIPSIFLYKTHQRSKSDLPRQLLENPEDLAWLVYDLICVWIFRQLEL